MSLEEKLMKRLEGGMFRILNDKMYHGKGLKKRDLKLYHELYDQQVKRWPVNPLDVIIEKIKKKGNGMAIADIGCGDARISREFENVMSLDLNPSRKDIIRCDMRQRIPLDDKSVDIAVCCLSMMAENISVPMKEVNRILRESGYWYIAEVKSRIPNIKHLEKKFESFGFEVEHTDMSNAQFILFVLKKNLDKNPKKLPPVRLIPWVYKKR
ncbi:putative methyltransferase [Encephalitozoon intestinalis ATCC 50506]|uniref:Ribosomal RNA-processing protein 8 n=1 Tax=Encephalitozoon intestinalis (strain ATCC 50506) TaxID=876142 RepID=E0S9L6_ENCIT|nr:putative methyltransferase [Encephalitozoon intestinalis ATCC 50506]ADM12401.1 putative methyltransferase [Encephalitozoon intestinalis ATCC 50506]UTX46233.1 putative methyltransferase [Encephalitozoon intestinalis]